MDFDYTNETITPDNTTAITINGQLEVAGHFSPSVNASVAATGTTQGAATLLTASISVVTSSTAGTALGVILPGTAAIIAGTQLTVVNGSANTITIYPPTNGVIDSGALNAAITLPVGASVTIVASAANGGAWYSSNKAIVAGTNITFTEGRGTTTINSTAAGGGSLIVKDESVNLTTAATSINFAGAGVTATTSGNDVTVTVSGGGSGAPADSQYLVLAADATLTNERSFAVSTDFVTTDAGAGNALTLKNRKGGENWTASTLPAVNPWYCVAYGRNRFVACGTSTNTNGAVSYDGITWAATVLPASVNWSEIAYGNGQFVAMQILGTQSVATSPDGVTWTQQSTVLPVGGTWNFLMFGNGTFVAAAYGTTTGAISVDGIYWRSVTLPASAGWNGGAFGDGTHVMVANGSTTALTSTDGGVTWAIRTMPSAAGWKSVAYGNGVFVAVANTTGGTSVGAYSLDMGVTWSSNALPATQLWQQVRYGNGVFVAVGNGTVCAISTDGIDWTASSMVSGDSWAGLAYGMGKFVAAANGVATSSYSKVGVSHIPGNSTNGLLVNDRGNIQAVDGAGTYGGNLWVSESSFSTPPPSGAVIFSKRLAGRMMPATVGPSNMDYTFQPAFWRQKVVRWNPMGNSATAPPVDGIVAFTVLGTATSRVIATTNLLTRTKRIGYASAATASAMCGIYNATAQFTTGNGAGLGGFFYSCRFAITDPAAVAQARFFCGMSSSVAAATNVSPSTLTNCIGVAQISPDTTQLHIVYGGSAAQTAIALGTNFPPMVGVGITNGVAYEFTLFAPPNLNGTVHYRLERIGTSFFAEGTLTPGTPGTQTPLSTTLLSPRIWRTNNSTLLAAGVDVLGLYLETDY